MTKRKGWNGERYRHGMAAKGVKTNFEQKSASSIKTMYAMYFGGALNIPISYKSLREIFYKWSNKQISSEEEMNKTVYLFQKLNYITDWTGTGKYWVMNSPQMMADVHWYNKDKLKLYNRIKTRLGQDYFIYEKEMNEMYGFDKIGDLNDMER